MQTHVSDDDSDSLERSEETRKIQYTGGSSYIVSLPKKWIQDMSLKQGDTVVISRQSNSTLLILPAARRFLKEHKGATVEVTSDNGPYFLARKIIALYFHGYSVINIVPRDSRLTGQQREAVKNVVRRVLMGTEIIADSASGVTLQVLINLAELSFDAAFKRMLIIAKSMHRDAIVALQENNTEIAREITKSDDEVDRFCFYIIRQLKLAIKNDKVLKDIGLEDVRNLLGYRLIAKSAERVADHATTIAKDIIELNRPLNQEITNKIAQMSNFALEVLDDACLAMFKKEYNSADTAIEKSHKIEEMEKSILMAARNVGDINEIYRIKMIIDNVRRVSEYASDIAEIVLNMTVEQTLRKEMK